MDNPKTDRPSFGDEIEFEDGEQYNGSSESLGVKQIVLRQYQKCLTEGAKELKGSGITKKLINGQVIEFMAPNQREIFINSVEMLKILLLPEITKNEKVIEKRMKKFNEKMDNLNKELNIAMSNNQTPIQNSGSVTPSDNVQNIKRYTSMKNEEVKRLQTNYEILKAQIYKDELLVTLSYLLNHMNYFEERGYSA